VRVCNFQKLSLAITLPNNIHHHHSSAIHPRLSITPANSARVLSSSYHQSRISPPTMADMDTYDNEPRAYDGMHDTSSLYNGRRIRSYGDLFEYQHSSSDHWSRASEGEFNINPHCSCSWHAIPFLEISY
jgi:hypothetical protein